jgi:hypothetical protein
MDEPLNSVCGYSTTRPARQLKPDFTGITLDDANRSKSGKRSRSPRTASAVTVSVKPTWVGSVDRVVPTVVVCMVKRHRIDEIGMGEGQM